MRYIFQSEKKRTMNLFDNSGPSIATDLALGTALLIISISITLYMLRRVRIIDSPNARSSHTVPTPKSGGIAIVSSYIITMALLLQRQDPTVPLPQSTVFFLSSLAVAAVSFYDDIHDLPFTTRLATHLVGALALIWTGLVIDPTLPGWIVWPATVFWIVGLTNAYNFMDGVDGLAGSATLASCFFFGLISLRLDNSYTYTLCIAVGTGSLGFLLFNRPPARIFMGDVGSAFIGFFLAAIALVGSSSEPLVPFPVMVMLLFHFIFDTGLTFFRRLLAGEPVTQAHRGHLYQLFNRLGASHATVTLSLLAMNVAQGTGALYMISQPPDVQWLVFLPFVVIQGVYAAVILGMARKKGLI